MQHSAALAWRSTGDLWRSTHDCRAPATSRRCHKSLQQWSSQTCFTHGHLCVCDLYDKHAGQAEQWQRIARIRLHQARQDSVAAVDKALEQSKQQVVQSESELEPEVPLSKHAAAKVRQVFESIISSEELPRQTGSVGSLSDHLNSSDKAGKDWPAKSMLVEGLQQIKAAHSATTQHRKLTLAGRWTPDDAAI